MVYSYNLTASLYNFLLLRGDYEKRKSKMIGFKIFIVCVMANIVNYYYVAKNFNLEGSVHNL